MLFSVFESALLYSVMKALARGPGVLAVGALGGGEGDRSGVGSAEGIVDFVELVEEGDLDCNSNCGSEEIDVCGLKLRCVVYATR
jgi:hypothetical protein